MSTTSDAVSTQNLCGGAGVRRLGKKPKHSRKLQCTSAVPSSPYIGEASQSKLNYCICLRAFYVVFRCVHRSRRVTAATVVAVAVEQPRRQGHYSGW